MKWIFISTLVVASSALTVYRNEDNVAMESQTDRGRPRDHYDSENKRDQSKRLRGGSRSEKNYRARDVTSDDIKQISLVPQNSDNEYQTTYFANNQEEGGHRLGYSSYIHHHGDKDAIKEGSSMEIQKIVPKSTVHVEMYHDHKDTSQLRQIPSKIQQKESTQSKLKVKPPKYYHEAISNYKKAQKTPTLHKEVSGTTSNYFSSTTTVTVKPKTYSSKRKPYSEKVEIKEPDVHNNHKAESFSQSFAGFSSVDHQPVHAGTTNTLKANKWNFLGDDMEIAVSSDSRPKRTRRPKEISQNLYANPGFFSDSGNKFSETERFKADRFDHEKALRGSTAFNIDNVLKFGEGSDFIINNKPKSVKSQGSPVFFPVNNTPSSRGPIQFANLNPTTTKRPLFQNYNYPAISEEEFDKQFARFRGKQLTRPEIKPKYRVPFDARSLPKKTQSLLDGPTVQKAQASTQHQAHSFAQFNNGRIDLTDGKETKENANISLHPAFKFPEQTRRNVSLIPESSDRVVSEYDNDSNEQQFSVSASYQINRRNRES